MMNAATRTELRAVPFHGDEIVTFEKDGSHYVAMRRIVENLQMDWASQWAKLDRDRGKFTVVEITTVDAQGRQYPMTCMPIEKLALWLATIHPNKIKNATTRAKVERYQAESAIVLHDYWTKGVAVRGDLEGVVTDISPEALKVIGGVVKAVVARQITAILPALVQEEISAHQYGVVRGVTAGGAIQLAGVTNRKGTRGLARMVSNRLLIAHAQKGVAVKLAELGPNRAYVFDPVTVKEWLADGGRVLIEKRIAELRGQGVLRLVPQPTDDAR